MLPIGWESSFTRTWRKQRGKARLYYRGRRQQKHRQRPDRRNPPRSSSRWAVRPARETAPPPPAGRQARSYNPDAQGAYPGGVEANPAGRYTGERIMAWRGKPPEDLTTDDRSLMRAIFHH